MTDRAQNAYHATTTSTGSCGPTRYTNAQPVTFDENNVPDFGIPLAWGVEIEPPSGEVANSTRKTKTRRG